MCYGRVRGRVKETTKTPYIFNEIWLSSYIIIKVLVILFFWKNLIKLFLVLRLCILPSTCVIYSTLRLGYRQLSLSTLHFWPKWWEISLSWPSLTLGLILVCFCACWFLIPQLLNLNQRRLRWCIVYCKTLKTLTSGPYVWLLRVDCVCVKYSLCPKIDDISSMSMSLRHTFD